MKLLKLIANLGYGSRKEVAQMFRDGRITDADGKPLAQDTAVEYSQIRVDDEALDPQPGAVIMLHKPVGYTCSTRDHGAVIYELLPERMRWRKPLVSSVGRLDRETSGLLLLTDDGALLHRLSSPKHATPKTYDATLARDLSGEEAAIFASGTLMLESETEPLKPAQLEILSPRLARLTITEGRYHQVRRMFAAVGNHVDALHRPQFGSLQLGDLAEGDWIVLAPERVAQLARPAPLNSAQTQTANRSVARIS